MAVDLGITCTSMAVLPRSVQGKRNTQPWLSASLHEVTWKGLRQTQVCIWFFGCVREKALTLGLGFACMAFLPRSMQGEVKIPWLCSLTSRTDIEVVGMCTDSSLQLVWVFKREIQLTLMTVHFAN